MRVWAGKGKGSPSPVLDGFIPLATANKGHVECGLQFPSEVGPSAAGQCRLPDFGGRKLSYG